MTRGPQIELGESFPRFGMHWIAACYGYFLMMLLPLIADWPHRLPNHGWPHWTTLLLLVPTTTLAAAIINANLPVTARELVKSVALGFALNATLSALRIF